MRLPTLFGAQYLFVVSLLVFGLYFYAVPRDKKINFLVFSGLDLALTYLTGLLAGRLYNNPRPFVSEHITPLFSHVADNGFPSDHILLTGALASIIFCYNRKLGIALYAVALVVGASRVVAGVHHWIDILGALAITILVGTAVYRTMRKHIYL